MTSAQKLTFSHAPNTRSTGTLTLLKELGAEYLATNSMGTVPAQPVIQAYIDKVAARPSVTWAAMKDAELAAAQETAA